MDVVKDYEKFIIPCYKRTPLVLIKGKGTKVWDNKGREYLDFFPGWAVSGLGHCHPLVAKAIKEQVEKIIHISNNYYHRWQAELGKELIKISFPGKCFFCNSGTEANEAAIKFCRLYGSRKGRYEIISFQNSFHGRTLATLALTGQKRIQKGFSPLPRGFKNVPFNDINRLKKAINKRTAAIFLEPIQGEGGINLVKKDFLISISKICKREDILVCFDEVQSGMGRTGKYFAFQHFGITPDVLTLAKTLGGGFPIGAMIVKKEIADIFSEGTHGSTFGGSPLACVSSLAVLKAIRKEKLLENAQKQGEYLIKGLKELKKKFKFIKEVRGLGLMIGVELNKEGEGIVNLCRQKGLLINCTQKKVLRILPPINVSRKEIDSALSILESSFTSSK